MSEPLKTLIIGGGISGLCAAWYARKREGEGRVLLLESSDAPGGTANTESADGFTFEKGPNGFLDKEPRTLQWVSELGLDGELIKANAAAAHRFIYRNGALHKLVPPPGFLFSPVLSLQGRLRLMAEPFIPQRTAPEPETIWDFAARRIGPEAADTLVSPMVSGIFGGNARHLELAACFPKMAAMEADHGGLFRAMLAKKKEKTAGSGTAMGPGGTLTSFRGGMATLINRAAERLGGDLRLNTPVVSLMKEGDHYVARAASGETFRAESVIVAAPTYAAAGMVRELDATLSETLAAIPYAGMVVVCTVYDREAVGHDMNGFGFLIPRTQQKRILGCIWTSTLFPGRAPKGKILLRTMIGGATDPEAVALDDNALLDIIREELFPIMRINAGPTMHRIFRWEKAIPQYTAGHAARVAAIETAEARHPGLRFAGNAYRGVGINDCVVSALRAVEALG